MEDEKHEQAEGLLPLYTELGALAQETRFDTDTVRRAIEGDKDAFATLFLGTYRQMYHVVHRFLKHDEDVYDAMQVGYTKAWKYIRRLDPPENFVPWLYRIMENAAKDTLRRLYDDMVIEREGETAVPDSAPQSDRAVDVRQALLSLDEAQMRLLTLYYYDGLTLREISQLQGAPIGTVYSRLRAARKRLVKALEDKGIDSAMYGNGIAGAIAVLLRNALGTDILSATVAQEMLERVTSAETDAVKVAAGKVLARQRDRAVLRLASLVAAVAVLFAALTAVLLWRFGAGGLPAESVSTPTVISTTTAVTTAADMSASGTSTADTGTSGTSTSVPTTATTVSTSVTKTTVTQTPPVFVPDYRKGYANTSSRNSVGNIARAFAGGLGIDFQDGWVYQNNGLKFRADGSGGKIRFSERNELPGMTVIGDWVYYLADEGICRVRTDGAVTETVVSHDKSGGVVDGFLVLDGKLYYSVTKTDSFGGNEIFLRTYELATGKDSFFTAREFSMHATILADGVFVNVESTVDVFDVESKTVNKAYDSSHMWGPDYSSSLYDHPLCSVLDGVLYNSGGHYVVLDTGVFRRLPIDGACLVEFADEATGRLAITLYEDIYPVDMRWYTPGEGFGESLPQEMWRTGREQRYHLDGNGRVYLVNENVETGAVLFSCNLDGSDRIEYE